MCHKQIISILLGMLAGSPVLGQEGSGEPPNPCTVEPVFHCAQAMNDGSVIGHFGYRSMCPESDKLVEDVYIPVGDDNCYTPGAIDRGQPKVFKQGEHIDEFEVEFSAKEVKEFDWRILKAGTRVDFTRTKDVFLDCNNLSYKYQLMIRYTSRAIRG